MHLIDLFDRILIINLAYRTDRRRAMDRQLKSVGLSRDKKVSYFRAIRPSDRGKFTSVGARGVFESQTRILRAAAEAGESVLILEDDCVFLPGAWTREFPNSWDIFYGGYTASDPQDLASSDIQGAHMMGFSREGVRLVSSYLEDLKHDGIHPPIDAAYVWFRRQHPEVPTYFAVPPIADQRPSRSDIAPLRWYDRIPAVRSLVNQLRGFKS